MTQLLLRHTIVGRQELTNFEFDSDKPYRCCLICGAVYQTERHRTMPTNPQSTPDLEHVVDVLKLNEGWAFRHARLHSEAEHLKLRQSGNAMTPEAAHRLAPYGLAPVMDMVMSEEHAHAAGTAPRAPQDDAESTFGGR